MPVVTAMPLPQYVLGTISPYPTERNVMDINHIVFNRLACSSSWCLQEKNETYEYVLKIVWRMCHIMVHIIWRPHRNRLRFSLSYIKRAFLFHPFLNLNPTTINNRSCHVFESPLRACLCSSSISKVWLNVAETSETNERVQDHLPPEERARNGHTGCN